MMLLGLSHGDLSTHMKLRSEDQLKDVAQAYNEAVDHFNSKIKTLKNASSVDEFKKELDKFKTS